MRLIKPSYEIIHQENTIDGIYKQIELAGRTCYKSEDKITNDSAKDFVDKLIKSGHNAMLEHGTVYLKVHENYMVVSRYQYNKYSIVANSDNEDDKNYYITTNYRVITENNWQEDMRYQCVPTEFHEKRVSVRFICDRGVSHEFVRHRVFSFAQESTRYCNYSKDKFGNELTFIEPCYLNKLCDNGGLDKNPETNYTDMFTKMDYLDILTNLELSYTAAIIAGLKPQEARMILPNSLKTELVMTGFISDWMHFFSLRCAKNAHPQARELAEPLSTDLLYFINN